MAYRFCSWQCHWKKVARKLRIRLPVQNVKSVGSLSNTKKPDEGGERDEENSPEDVSRAEVAEGPELGRIRAYPGSHRRRGDLGA